jgi:Flp pilus assembly protein TadG
MSAVEILQQSVSKEKKLMRSWHRTLRPLLQGAWREDRLRQGTRGIFSEEGSSLVEMALSCAVVVTMLLGIVEMSFALFSYDYISDAAREGSRYAIVRGSKSCSNTPSLTNCNATADKVQTYIKGLGYPGINSANMTVTTTWLTASATKPTTWSTCSSGTCNAPGNIVKVQVNYAFPISIPFVRLTTINVASTSQMVIAQ